MQHRTNQPSDQTHQDDEVVELHWMYEGDLGRCADRRTAVPALCGARFVPDDLDGAGSSAGGRVRYVDCKTCDIVLELDVQLRRSA